MFCFGQKVSVDTGNVAIETLCMRTLCHKRSYEEWQRITIRMRASTSLYLTVSEYIVNLPFVQECKPFCIHLLASIFKP